MNLVWTTFVILSTICLLFVDPSSFLGVTVDACGDALKNALKLAGVYCLWMGVFKVMEDTGLVGKLAKVTSKLTSFLYGKINEAAASYIAVNMSANLLGVSNAATPSAILAIKETEKDNEKLSRAGTMLFVINATSIQILPTTVMGMRAACNSAAPYDIILPTLISTLITTVLGIILVNVFYPKEKK